MYVLTGMVGDLSVGPYLLPAPLTSTDCFIFLKELLSSLYDPVPQHVRHYMWFLNDGAPPHYCRYVREHLNEVFGHRWIGRRGPVSWQPRSLDLSSMDFFRGSIEKFCARNTRGLRNGPGFKNRLCCCRYPAKSWCIWVSPTVYNPPL